MEQGQETDTENKERGGGLRALDSYLADLNEQAQERYELIEAQMRSAEGVTEDLKAQNPMEWVRRANNIRNRAQEIVLSELVYV